VVGVEEVEAPRLLLLLLLLLWMVLRRVVGRRRRVCLWVEWRGRIGEEWVPAVENGTVVWDGMVVALGNTWWPRQQPGLQ
jgi:hypothetical protein